MASLSGSNVRNTMKNLNSSPYSPEAYATGKTYARRRKTAQMAIAGIAAAAVLSACSAANETAGATDSDLAGELNGAGASSQEAAVTALSSGFQKDHPDVTVNYDPVGSGSGREQFIAGGTDFAGTDAPFDEDELAAASKKCAADIIEVPTYVSPIAVVFNVDGVDRLNLDAATLAAIFSGQITHWDDPQIAADNPDADLPPTPITPVHRSDESGTTGNFTDYLAEAAPKEWTQGSVESWPFNSGEGAEGTSGVMAAVHGGDGTIGYADASQAKDVGTVKLKVGDEFVEYSPEAAAKALEVSERVDADADSILTFNLDRTTTEADTYPLILVSYQLACSSYESESTADLVRAWLDYVASEEGQKLSADGSGSAPLSASVRQDIQHIAETISAA